MFRDQFISESLLKGAENYWESYHGKEVERSLTGLNATDIESADELWTILRTSEDKAALNAASAKLRTLVQDAFEALRATSKGVQVLCGAGINDFSTILQEQLRLLSYIRDRVAAPWVDSSDISVAVSKSGISMGDILLVHSSYTLLGHVIGGPQAVVDALEAVIGGEGTLVMPTLCQKNFERAYLDWNINRPSDVGFLTEYFRKLPGVFRSDQATHSVAARGRLAKEITKEHGAWGPRLCLFGVTAFSHSSPWQKMYDLGGKVLFLGAKANTNTYKHFIECCLIERRLDAVNDPSEKQRLINGLWTYDEFQKVLNGETCKVWPMYNSVQVTEALDNEGFVRHEKVGDADLLCMDIRTMVNEVTRILEANIEKWYPKNAVKWFNEVDEVLRKQNK